MIYKKIKEIYCTDCEEQLPETDSAFDGNTDYDIENSLFVCDKCLDESEQKHEFDSPHRLEVVNERKKIAQR